MLSYMRRLVPPRVLLLQGLLIGLSVVLVTAALKAKRVDPTMSTSISLGSIHCETYIDAADGDWRIDASQTLLTPSGRYLTPACGASTYYPPLDIQTDMDTPAWTRPGVWSCNAGASGISSGGASWGGNSSASVNLPNPTCTCISGGDNFGMIYGGPNLWSVDPSIETLQANRIQQWVDTSEPWWNNLFQWVGSSKYLSSIPYNGNRIYVRDLSWLPGTVMMRFTNDLRNDPTGTGEIRIEVDPNVFLYGDDLATTWMAHELGHSIGIADHSVCDQNSSLMAAVINVPQSGIDKDAEKCWMFSEYGNFHQTCTHFP